ncbi:MAG TPA: sugar ABC transporter ATP-binding protein [Steroidobacteraceae bacterium]|jgi:simple sugar transport system ATP-binding protein|nr:sugar ABC transporter ATP-binding protein [Steroidobacteraceae bacterium]
MTHGAEIVLKARDISRAFPGVQALASVELTLRAGEVHALMGQNGAGKSTLIKVLTGVYAPDAGSIELLGRQVQPASPIHAQELGISAVHQESHLLPNLSVAENICAGRYPRRPWSRGGGIDWRETERRARELLAGLGIKLDVTQLAGGLPAALQQLATVARAVATDARVLILDEPTSSLDADEVQALFVLLRTLRDKGVAILFVTHFLDQVYEICDRMTVLRNGRFVGEYACGKLDARGLVAAMVGREVAAAQKSAASPQAAADTAPPVLAAKDVSRRGQLKPVDIELKRGEVLGLAGLLGSGRTELARLLFALDQRDSGEISIDGKPAKLDRPADALALGLGFCPEDRKHSGIIAELSVRENIALALQARMGLTKFLKVAEQRQIAEKLVAALGIKTPSIETPIGQLSGGNQQKAIVARWLAINPRVLILDEPTRGIDVAAKQELMNEILELARGGTAVLFISAEIEEVVRVSDRIVVLRDRAKAGELPSGSDQDAVYSMIATTNGS